MPVDFKEIKEGEDFELLCEDLLRAMGFTIVHQSARGPEGGKDLIVSETFTDRVGVTEERKTLVQCKHHAHSGKAVGFNEVANYRDVMDQYGVRRYLLITSTVPTEDLREKFEKTSRTGEYVTSIWSKGDLARLLDQHLDIRERYFPSSVIEAPLRCDTIAYIVEGLFAWMGFACRERQVTSDYVRLVYDSIWPYVRPVAVVCKAGTVERCDVEALIEEVETQELDHGVLVTSTCISPAARERAAEMGDAVSVIMLDEVPKLLEAAIGLFVETLTAIFSSMVMLRGILGINRAGEDAGRTVETLLIPLVQSRRHVLGFRDPDDLYNIAVYVWNGEERFFECLYRACDDRIDRLDRCWRAGQGYVRLAYAANGTMIIPDASLVPEDPTEDTVRDLRLYRSIAAFLIHGKDEDGVPSVTHPIGVLIMTSSKPGHFYGRDVCALVGETYAEMLGLYLGHSKPAKI